VADLTKIMLVFGTRPEAIKMIPVARELRRNQHLKLITVTTGQHRDMVAQVLNEFAENVDIDLDLMSPDQTLEELTSLILTHVSALLRKQRPNLILVHGDTTTAFASALSGFYEQIPVAHVEAGLRSYDLARPWPEEMNRVMIDSIATLMFAPTESAAAALRGEYNRHSGIYVTGNTGIDALLSVYHQIEATEPVGGENWDTPISVGGEDRLILVTGHRRESFGDGFERICDALASIAKKHRVQIVYPVHLNPRVRNLVTKRLGSIPRISLIEPVGYFDMVRLMRRATLILTDSGGLQEEGPALGRPVLVMRDVTERPEAIATGVVKLVGTDPEAIEREVATLLENPVHYARVARPVFPYGDGTASRQIADIISSRFSNVASAAGAASPAGRGWREPPSSPVTSAV
jgi:UDP-N-acetylglucosamine 2-epimerase (non-hydrolysing)